MLQVNGLNSGYGNAQIIYDLSLGVGEKKIVSIIGPNGAGKTTLLLTLTGIIKPYSGEVRLDGEDITRLEPYERVGRGLVLAPERRRLFPEMTVLENLLMGAYHRKDKKGVGEDLEMVYQIFPALKARKNQMAGTLSGGEQQMVAIGRALMSRPKLLLLDEPSVGLAPSLREKIFDAVAKIREDRGVTVLAAEQDASVALPISDEAHVLEHGRITLSGTAGEIMSNPKVREAYLGL